MIPDRSQLLAEINKLKEEKALREKEISGFLEEVRKIRKEIENVDARLRSQWATYNKFYRDEK